MLTQQAVTFIDMRDGGYVQIYAIKDKGTVIGRKIVKRKTRKDNEVVTYQLEEDDRTFSSAAALVAAYKENGH